jgi:hypothetical protein
LDRKKNLEFRFMIILFLVLAEGAGLFAQESKRYPVLSKYHKFGIIAGPVLYNKAELYPQYGEYSFKNKHIWGFNAGFEFDLFPDRKWSFLTALMFSYEPVYNLDYRIKKEDLYPVYTEDDYGEARMYANPSFYVPLLVRLNIQANQQLFVNFLTGLRVLYFPPGGASLTVTYHNENDTESKEVFGIRAESPDNALQGSFVIGSGMAFAWNYILFKTSIIYVMNFQNIIEGEYQFGNLSVSDPTRGYYELSGNYIGLLVSVSLAKKKNKY